MKAHDMAPVACVAIDVSDLLVVRFVFFKVGR
jgi:hypothetical protein